MVSKTPSKRRFKRRWPNNRPKQSTRIALNPLRRVFLWAFRTHKKAHSGPPFINNP